MKKRLKEDEAIVIDIVINDINIIFNRLGVCK